MKGWIRFIVLILAIIIINLGTWAIMVNNLWNDVYPVDADSIGIPIFQTILTSLGVLPILVLIAFLPHAQFISRLCLRGIAKAICIGSFLLVLYLAAGFYSIAGASYWAIPDHYMIALLYIILLIALAFMFIYDARLWFSNLRVQGTQTARP